MRSQKIIGAFSPTRDWGPINPKTFQEWLNYNDANANWPQSYINTAFTIDDITVVPTIKPDN